MCTCSAVLAPSHTSPSSAAAGSTACPFSHTNPSVVVPVAHSTSSTLPGPAFSRLSAALHAHAFARLSTAALGFTSVRSSPKITFQAKIMPGNALACVHLSPGRLRNNACLSDMCLMFVFLTLSFRDRFIFRVRNFDSCLTAVTKLLGSTLFGSVTLYVQACSKGPPITNHHTLSRVPGFKLW